MAPAVVDRHKLWKPFGNVDEKKVVPWFSMSEWRSVRSLLYSELNTDHQEGYKRLCGWKARCRSLPAPIECTLSIFHVLLGDPDYLTPRATSLSREQELRLMYSTSVMRFLNLMLEVQNEDMAGTMYTRAAMRNIPEWLVNLRHDAAHGQSLPELSLLRSAALFIRKWLYAYYWEDDNQETTDWVVSEEEVVSPSNFMKELLSIIEAWEALSLYKLSGFSNLDQIPYSDLRSSVIVMEKLQQSLQEDDMQLSHETSLKKPAKVSSALTLIESKLRTFMNKHLHTIEVQDVLCDMLISGDVLLPSKNLVKIMDPDEELDLDNVQFLLPKLEEHWEGMMFILWEVESIPFLLKRLISVSLDDLKTNLQGSLAALWAQKLILSCIKVREARQVHCALAKENKLDDVYSAYKPAFEFADRKEVLASVAIAAVENQREDLKRGYSWKLLPLPEKLVSLDLVRHALSSPPPERCRLFLPHLFELVSPPIPESVQQRLMELMIICNQGQLEHVVENEDRLYSVTDLLAPLNASNENNENESLLKKVKNPWKPSQEHLEWGSCPIGLLPWQQKQQRRDMEEYEQRQQQRTWSRLSLEGDWTATAASTNGTRDNDRPMNASETNVISKDKLRVIQNGRVSKPTLSTPKQSKMKAFGKLSPNIAQLLRDC